ncbi:MAG: pyruvate kinase [Candidatus Eisenbacteria sp.]|nr:pyruvate kinase [Candidatus Eisenbacteria bacterium]
MTRRTKLVCTLGPSSTTPEAIRSLVEAGMDVARLNFSHGSHKEHGERIRTIRQVEEETGRTVAILQDLGGPKIRVGEIPGGAIRLEPDQDFTLTSRDIPGNAGEVSVSYPALAKEVQCGTPVLLADGLIELEILETTDTDVHCRVLTGGLLSSHKGINLPSATLSVPALTEKDRRDLDFGIASGVDLVALSFVRQPDEVLEVRRIIQSRGAHIPVIAKIEKHEALEQLDDILAACDACMVARGDLGVEIPLERVPIVQKAIIRKAMNLGRPVITATQMLASMVESPRPTRAEATDVANAVLDGTDAVMLSEETAVGKYPTRVVETISRIVREAETALPPHALPQDDALAADIPGAISGAVCYLADQLGAKAIVIPTESGTTARLVARHRPRQPILAFSTITGTVRALKMTWGVLPYEIHPASDQDEVTQCMAAAKERGLLKSGDLVILTAGMPIWTQGTTNLIRVETVP